MEIQDDQSPEAKFGPSVATLPTAITLINIGNLTEKAQLSTRHLNKALATKWCQLLMLSWLLQGQRKATVETSTVDYETYWTSNSFQWVWFCVCGSQVLWNPVTYRVMHGLLFCSIGSQSYNTIVLHARDHETSLKCLIFPSIYVTVFLLLLHLQ